MLSGVSNFIKKNLSLKQQNNDSLEQSLGPRPGDRVEDDFLLVGETASERSTVYTNSFRANQVNCPPGYSEAAQSGLPSYSEYTSHVQQYSPTIDNSDFRYGNPFQTGMPTTHSGASCSRTQDNVTSTGLPYSSPGEAVNREATYRSAIADVPFTLGATSAVSSSVNELRANDLLSQRTFDYSCYDYDFSLEIKFLTEHGSFNADMDWQ